MDEIPIVMKVIRNGRPAKNVLIACGRHAVSTNDSGEAKIYFTRDPKYADVHPSGLPFRYRLPGDIIRDAPFNLPAEVNGTITIQLE